MDKQEVDGINKNYSKQKISSEKINIVSDGHKIENSRENIVYMLIIIVDIYVKKISINRIKKRVV